MSLSVTVSLCENDDIFTPAPGPPFKSHQVMFGSFWQKFSAAGHFQSLVRFCHGDMTIIDEFNFVHL